MEVPQKVSETWERVLSYQSSAGEIQDMLMGEWVAYRIVEEHDEDDAGVYLMSAKEFDYWVGGAKAPPLIGNSLLYRPHNTQHTADLGLPTYPSNPP